MDNWSWEDDLDELASYYQAADWCGYIEPPDYDWSETYAFIDSIPEKKEGI